MDAKDTKDTKDNKDTKVKSCHSIFLCVLRVD